MNRYMVESIHTKEEYLKLKYSADTYGYITHCEWGCACGIHTGWVIIEADSELEALLSVPPLIRRNAKAVQICRLTLNNDKINFINKNKENFERKISMNRYLVESPHTKEDCLHVLDLVVAAGHITHYDWGCEAGIHTGWTIVEADSEDEALYSVPAIIRNKARAIRLCKFTPKIIQSFHEQAQS